jgi:hypothetical protein
MPTRAVLNYSTERAAQAAIKRLLKRYPVDAGCRVEAVSSPHWLYPFRWLIAMTALDGHTYYWTRSCQR